MKKVLLILLLSVLAIPFQMEAGGKDKDAVPEYTIEGAGTAAQGTYLINVTVISKDKKITDVDLKRAAVHGVLFKGFSNTEKRQMQKPLAGSMANYAQHADFYKDFFAQNGMSKDFCSVIEGSHSVKKVNKMYHFGCTISVNKETLRKFLEDAGIIKGLNSAF